MWALESGADYVGFVLYSGSPRGIRPMALARIADRLERGARVVAVFVNEPADAVAGVAKDCGLCAVQLHGDEARGGYLEMPCAVWRAVRLEAGACTPDPADWVGVERFVVDASVPGVYGGSGVTADWRAAAGFAAKYPAMLAGGLNPGNVAEAVRAVAPLGVDTSSGVELEPGRKDKDKVKRFIAEAKRNEPDA
jgi:phosphoribosylanthranilate isomerase